MIPLGGSPEGRVTKRKTPARQTRLAGVSKLGRPWVDNHRACLLVVTRGDRLVTTLTLASHSRKHRPPSQADAVRSYPLRLW